MHGTVLLAASLTIAPAPERPPIQRPSGLRPVRPEAPPPQPTEPAVPPAPGDPAPDPVPEPEPPRAPPAPTPAPEPKPQPQPSPVAEPAPVPAPAPAEPPELAPTPPPTTPAPAPVAPLEPPPAPEGPQPVSVSAEPPPTPLAPPRWSGRGLLITAGLLGAAAFGQQAGAWAIAKDTCSKPFEDDSDAGTSIAFVDCLYQESRALSLRVTSTLTLGVALGLGTAGAVYLARHHAHRDAETGRTRGYKGMIIAGASLLGVGTVAWLTTRILVQDNRIGCSDQACAVKADMLTLDASVVISAVGTGLLGYGLGYRNRRRKLAGELTLAPAVDRHGLALAVAGRL